MQAATVAARCEFATARLGHGHEADLRNEQA